MPVLNLDTNCDTLGCRRLFQKLLMKFDFHRNCHFGYLVLGRTFPCVRFVMNFFTQHALDRAQRLLLEIPVLVRSLKSSNVELG